MPYDPAHRAQFVIPSPEPAEPPYFCLKINAAYRGFLSGMLDRLAYADVWQGEEHEIAIAVNRIEEIQAALGLPCDDDDAPPFWEDHTDFDGTYGDIPLHSRVGLWILTGFMLYSGDPVAVLVYRHSVRRLLISYYQSGWGGVFRVIVNGQLIDTIDSAGPDAIKDLIYDIDELLPFAATAQAALIDDPYELRIERVDDDPDKAIGIMRRRLLAPDPTVIDDAEWILNFNADLGTVELFKNDTLIDSVPVNELVEPPWDDETPPPDYDAPPPVDIPCSAATAAQKRFRELIWQPLYDRHLTATNFLSFVYGAYAILVATPIVTMSLEIYRQLWSFFNSGINLDDDDWQEVRCVFYRNLPASGLFDDDVLSDIASELLAMNNIKMTVIAALITAMRWNGVNYSERVEPDGSADCADCISTEPWTYVWDTTQDQPTLLDWRADRSAQYAYDSTGLRTIIDSGNAHHLRFARPSNTFTLIWIEYEYDFPSSISSANFIRSIYPTPPVSTPSSSTVTPSVGTSRTTRWTPNNPTIVNGVGMYLSYNRTTHSHARLTKVTIHGTGDQPFD